MLHERFHGDIDLDRLVACVEGVLRWHEAPRTRFGERDGTPYQWVEAEAPAVQVVELPGEPDTPAACRRWMRAEQQRPMPLRDSPMIRATVIVESSRVAHVYTVSHHLIMDGWSLNLLGTQIVEAYAAVMGGGRPRGDAPVPYRSFLSEEATYRESPECTGDREFHQKAISGAAPALFTRSPSETHRAGARFSFSLPGEWVDKVRRAGLSVFPYLAAMVGTYLARIHRTEEAIIGVPFLNRPKGFDEAIGHFANTLPLRVPARSGQTVRELVAEVQATTRDLREHARTPLGEVLRALPGGTRQLYDVALTYLRVPGPDHAAPHVFAHKTTMESPCHEQDALSVVVLAFDDVDEIQFDLDYASDVFGGDFRIEAVAGHLKNLLEHGVACADGPVADVPMLSAAERAVLIGEYGRGERNPFREDVTLAGLFEEQVARHPGQVAVTGPRVGDAMTYAELDAGANQVARKLHDGGVGPGDRVAVLMERGSGLLVALLGILKAGAAYVPVDPGYPAERIRFLLADSRPAAILASDPDASPVPGGTPVWRVADLLHGDASPLGRTAKATDFAYVIYTSGSSGRPKGVQVRHRSVVNRLAWMQRRYPLCESDVLLQKTPVSFDVSVWELFWWAVEGASVALLPPGGEKDPRVIRQAVRDHGVTVAHFVPSMLGAFLESAQDAGVSDAGTLRLVFCSGEALPAARVDQFNRLFHRERPTPALVNLYGPTEATVDVTFHDCPDDPGRSVDLVPIGRPIDNIQLYVTGRDGTLQPAGVAGELCIGGVGVAAGYLDRPELTRERFVADPFTGEGRLYRTGDLVRWLPDGSLEYLGRLDDQVKIRGNRVELGEVTSALIAAPGVRDALVVDRTTAKRGVHLVGYYVADPATDVTDLRAHLARTLPEFMVPTFLVSVERIPLTPNGKADGGALPAVAAARSAGRPLTEKEAVLADVWSEVLGCGPVSPDDGYYALGGDSLLMLRIRALAEKRGLRFSLADLVRHSTVAALAERAVTGSTEEDAAPLPFELVPGVDRARLGEAQDAYPLTRLQLGLIYHSRRNETSAVYKDVFRYTLRLDWDEARFRQAFTRLAERHPVLRASFQLAGCTEPLQVIHPAVPAGFDVVDLHGRPEEEAEAEVLRHIEERRHHDYAFENAPLYLFRAHVRESGVDLVLSFHHALLDGGSVATLVSELLRDYGHAIGLETGPVPDIVPPSAAAHVLAERRALASADSARYWSGHLDGSEPSSIGTFRPHTSAAARAVSHRFDLPERLGDDVRRFAHDNGLPVKSVLFAAHCLTLRLLSGTADVTTGLITHGRPEQAGGDGMAGLFLNTLPLRVNTAMDSWEDVIREAFRTEQDSYPHRRYPLSAIQEKLGRPPVGTAFNYVHFHQLGDVLQTPGMAITAFHTYEETNFAILVNAVTDPVDRHLWLRIDGDGEATEAQLRLFGSYYTRIAERMVGRPAERPGWDFLTAPPPPADVHTGSGASVVARFEDQAARTPDAVALAADGERWTYARLAETAGAVANNLLRRGIQPGAIVGIVVDRTPETIAVLLGTLRAGGAVMPLDSGYPARRLEYMVEQADPFLVIGQHAALPDRSALTVLPGEITATTDATLPLPRITPESAAYVLFTSGSTGQPKGVEMPHRALANLVQWQNSVASGDVGVTLQYAPLSFDVSFQEIFSTLCAGGTLRLVAEETRRDMPALLRLIHEEGVERVLLPYIALQQLAAAAEALGIFPAALRVIISSGEQLRVTDEIRRLCSARADVLLENQYGPTETHVVTRHTMTGLPAAFPDLPPIGTAIDGVRVHVLDSRLRPVPTGVTGELYVGGICLAHGYLDRETLTRERFVEIAHERLYRTGDLGFVLPDGTTVCAGRSDTQVKIRGFRVETAEVELAIRELSTRYPGIEEAAVIARIRKGSGEAELVAFLTGDPSTTDIGTIRGALRERLPEYMIPSHIRWLAALPSTPSGKRDDAALRAVPVDVTASQDTTLPRNEHERALCEILADLLQLPAIGIHDNFFDLGGTSLTAMRLVVMVEQRFGTGIPLSDFIAMPTVAKLAGRLQSHGAQPGSFRALVPLRSSGTRPPLFMVHPMGGNVLCYVPFAKHLPADQPLYALQAAGAEPGTEPLSSVEDLADSYLAELTEIQPHGPYTISGWSFGGFVAFEMACRLREVGEEVSRLILLDTVAVNPQLRDRYADEALLGWFFWELLWLERGSASPLQAIPEGITSLDGRFDYIARRATELGVLPAESSGALIRRLFRVYRANWQAALAYRPEDNGQDIVLVRADEPLPEVLEVMHGAAGSLHHQPDNGWRRMTSGRIEVTGVPGNHLSMMEEPRVARLARTVAGLVRNPLPPIHRRAETA